MDTRGTDHRIRISGDNGHRGSEGGGSKRQNEK
jgi:hypothetical protein